MVNPHYKVTLHKNTQYFIDSGAFQERDIHSRLQPWSALDRQLRLETYISWNNGPDHAAGIVTYDMLAGVDEAFVHKKTGVEVSPDNILQIPRYALKDYKRIKKRGTPEKAQIAVNETIRSAKYYKSQEHRIAGSILYACQGATPDQYIACALEILPLLRKDRDIFAFGGFCIIGKVPSLKAVYYETLARLLPILKDYGINKAHVLGVTVSDAIARTIEMTKPYNIQFSTDSSSPEINAAIYGRSFCEDDYIYKKRYERHEKYVEYIPCDLALESIKNYNNWITQESEKP